MVRSGNRMQRIRETFSLSIVVVSMVLGMVGIADAQKRNDKDIRDAVRILNSRIEDFETNLRYQMQSSSASTGQVSAVSDSIRSLRNNVQHFQDSYDRKRETRDDVNEIIAAALRIEDFLSTDPQ